MLRFGNDGPGHNFSSLTGSSSESHQVVRIGGDQQPLMMPSEQETNSSLHPSTIEYNPGEVADSLDDWF